MNLEAAGAALRELREDRDISIEDLAETSGISPMGISYLERGMRKPRKSTVQKLELALGLPPGTHRRLVFSPDARAELASIVATTAQATAKAHAEVSAGGSVVGRSVATTALLGSYAAAQVASLHDVIARMPAETAPDYESQLGYILGRTSDTEGLTADSWRVAASSDAAEAGQLLAHLETLEHTRRELTDKLAHRSLSAKLDSACATSPLPDALIAQMLGISAEELWRWRNQGVIPSEAIPLVQTFTARRRAPSPQ